MLWVAFETGVDDLRNLVVCRQVFGNSHCVFAVTVHAHMQRFGAAQDQECVHWPRRAAAGVLEVHELFVQLLVVAEQRATDDITVTAEILGG